MTKMPCYAWIRGDCKLGDKCRFEHDPKSAPKSCGADKKGKNSKGKGKRGKVVQPGRRHVQKCFRYLKGKCEKGKDCGFMHSKDDPSKGDPEVQRRMAEKKTSWQERGFLRTSDIECSWRRKLSRVCCG